MRRETDLRAVFVDTDLGLPVYGQRALYVALPKREKFNEITTKGGDGYSFDPRIFMKIVDGYSADLVDRRFQIAARLLSGAEPTATARRRRDAPAGRDRAACCGEHAGARAVADSARDAAPGRA